MNRKTACDRESCCLGNGRVVGVDLGESQIQRAIESAKERGIANALFQQAVATRCRLKMRALTVSSATP